MLVQSNVDLVNRNVSTFLIDVTLKKLRAMLVGTSGNMNSAAAHAEPIKFGLAKMIYDISNNSGKNSSYYPSSISTRDAFHFLHMLDGVKSRITPQEIASLKDAFKRDGKQKADFSSIALEVWTYINFIHPNNQVTLNIKNGPGWDVKVLSEGKIFHIQCKAVRYGGGRSSHSDAFLFQRMLNEVNRLNGEAWVNSRFLGFEFTEPKNLKQNGMPEKLGEYLAGVAKGQVRDSPFPETIKLIAEGYVGLENADAFLERFHVLTSITPPYRLSVKTDKDRELGFSVFSMPQNIRELINRCETEFDSAIAGLKNFDNPIIVLGIEALHIRMTDGPEGITERRNLDQTISLLIPQLWRMIRNKSEWKKCYGCLLTFRVPASTTPLANGRRVDPRYILSWSDPRGGTTAPDLPQFNNDTALQLPPTSPYF